MNNYCLFYKESQTISPYFHFMVEVSDLEFEIFILRF